MNEGEQDLNKAKEEKLSRLGALKFQPVWLLNVFTLEGFPTKPDQLAEIGEYWGPSRDARGNWYAFIRILDEKDKKLIKLITVPLEAVEISAENKIQIHCEQTEAMAKGSWYIRKGMSLEEKLDLLQLRDEFGNPI